MSRQFFSKRLTRVTGLLSVALLVGCAKPIPGPDKQGQGMLVGGALGAGAGAVTGFQVGASTGPGALVGAGLGAVWGSISGIAADAAEEAELAQKHRLAGEAERAFVHQILHNELQRRVRLHPAREIYPADLFFYGDGAQVTARGAAILREVARLNKRRLPWSRLAVRSYVQSSDPEAMYNKHLATKRAQDISDHLVRGGLEPRRLVSQGVLVEAPILIDPQDKPSRYSQAIELIPLDR